jgi:hypothetical protein
MALNSAWLLVGLVGVILAGCAGGLKAGAPDSPTGGIAIEIFRTDERSSHALYVVDPDGTISFGGGFDAQQERTTWSAPMTAEQIVSLQAILSEQLWQQAPVRSEEASDPGSVECRILFAAPAISWRATVPADNPRVSPVVEFLRELSLARHEEVLRSLPQANQPQSGGE